AVVRLVGGRPAYDWLWATVLLGLPGGWLGPFDTVGPPPPGSAVPHFGRLAHVLLVTCVAAAAMLWLAQRRAPGAPAASTPDGRVLAGAGAVALGCTAGIAVLLGLVATGLAGVHATRPDGGPPPRVVATLAVLVVTGGAALAGARTARAWRTAAGAAPAGLAAAWLVAAYANPRTLRAPSRLRLTATR